jgi:L-ribulose-5-phosphate 3-epimerase
MLEYQLGLYEKAIPPTYPIDEILMYVRESGFDFLEISIDETDEKLSRLKWSDARKFKLVQAIWNTGVKIQTMCLSGHRRYPIGSEDELIRSKGMEIMAEAINFASDIGIRIIQVAGYDEYYRPSNANTLQFFGDNLYRSTELAAKKGIILAFETMETEFMNTVEKAMSFVHKIRSPYLQVYPDLGNITNAALGSSSAVAADLELGRGHIVAMHLKETVPGIFRQVPYGTGHVDFKKAIAQLLDMGVRLFVGEFWHIDQKDFREQLAFASRFLRNQFILSK